MRVALLTNFIAPYRVPLLEALRDRVGELRVFLSTPMEEDRDWAVDWGSLDVVVQRNVTLRRTRRDSAGFTTGLLIHFPYDTIAQLARYRPDVVISGELGARSAQAALYRLARPSAPLLIWGTLSERSEAGWGAARRGLRRAIFGMADGALTNGESGARYIRRFGVPDERIFRVNQPVPVEMFAREPRSRAAGPTTRLLHVGMLIARKGVRGVADGLADWARRRPERSLEIWWAGYGDQRAALEALELPSNLVQRFLGSLPYAALPQVYAQCDMLAFPTLCDEWGLVVNEAMAAGLPVLGSAHGQAVEELVTEGETGWIFDPLIGGSLTAALDRALATSPERVAEMGVVARRRALLLTPAAAAERIVRAIATVLDARRGNVAEAARSLSE